MLNVVVFFRVDTFCVMAFLIPIAIGAGAMMTANKLYDYFKCPPPNPPPDASPELKQRVLIREAQEKLGMDVESHYNFAVCGSSGTGIFLLSVNLLCIM